jgi:hypothetical protein
MKVISLAFVAATTLACAVCTVAQGQSLSSSKPDRTVGAAEVYYFKEKNKTRAQVRIYAVGKPDGKNDKQDILSMDVIFESDGSKVGTPKNVYLAFLSHSPTGPKYRKDDELHVSTEGLEGFARTTYRTSILSSSRTPSGVSVEVILSPIDYKTFLRIISAHLVWVDLGETRFVLKKEDMKALNDLNKTIEN